MIESITHPVTPFSQSGLKDPTPPPFLEFNHPISNEDEKKMREFFVNELGRSIQRHLEKMKKHYRKMRQEYYR